MVCLSLAVLLAACEAPSEPEAAATPELDWRGGVRHRLTGAGDYDIAGLIVHFRVNAKLFGDGTAVGNFAHRTEFSGLVVDFRGVVTCLTVDPATQRAWVGGVITENLSTDPSFQAAIHQPGKDIWFRVVDYGKGPDAPADRTTFTGFEGGGGILTSPEYCDARIWPAGDARTWPVVAGSIQLQ